MPRFAFLAGAVAAVGGALFGYDTGVISGAALFIQPALALNIVQVELVVSAPLIGAAIGAIGSARVTDSLGRRIALLAAAAMFVIRALASAFSVNALMLVSARILIGLAIGAAPCSFFWVSPRCPKCRAGLPAQASQTWRDRS